MQQTTYGGAGQLMPVNGGRRAGSERRPLAQKRLADGLGVFSVGLGLAQVFAPHFVARMIGLRPDRSTTNTMLACGLREITSGVGILSSSQRAPWLWLRVGGDLVDLVLIGSAARSNSALGRNHLAGAAALVGGALLLDAVVAGQHSRGTRHALAPRREPRTEPVTELVSILKSPEEVYRFWRNFENLPRFMAHLESVKVIDDRRSHWKVKGPAGTHIEWDAEITEDRPNELIAWRSLEGADVQNSGTVRFQRAPGDRGTFVRVDLQYDAPGGKLGTLLAKLFGREPAQQTKGDLRRFKQVIETGEVVHSDASIHRGKHPARPTEGAVLRPIYQEET